MRLWGGRCGEGGGQFRSCDSRFIGLCYFIIYKLKVLICIFVCFIASKRLIWGSDRGRLGNCQGICIRHIYNIEQVTFPDM